MVFQIGSDQSKGTVDVEGKEAAREARTSNQEVFKVLTLGYK
jgi:hypothetical protein